MLVFFIETCKMHLMQSNLKFFSTLYNASSIRFFSVSTVLSEILPCDLPGVCASLKKVKFYNSPVLRETILTRINLCVSELTIQQNLDCLKAVTDIYNGNYSNGNIRDAFALRLTHRPALWSRVLNLNGISNNFIEMSPKVSHNVFFDIVQCAISLGLNTTAFLEKILPQIPQRLCVNSHGIVHSENRTLISPDWVETKEIRTELARVVEIACILVHQGQWNTVYNHEDLVKTNEIIISAISAALPIIFQSDPEQAWHIVGALARWKSKLFIRDLTTKIRNISNTNFPWHIAKHFPQILYFVQVENNSIIEMACTAFLDYINTIVNESNCESFRSQLQFIIDLSRVSQDYPVHHNQLPNHLSIFLSIIIERLPSLKNESLYTLFQITSNFQLFILNPKRSPPSNSSPYQIPECFNYSLLKVLISEYSSRLLEEKKKNCPNNIICSPCLSRIAGLLHTFQWPAKQTNHITDILIIYQNIKYLISGAHTMTDIFMLINSVLYFSKYFKDRDSIGKSCKHCLERMIYLYKIEGFKDHDIIYAAKCIPNLRSVSLHKEAYNLALLLKHRLTQAPLNFLTLLSLIREIPYELCISACEPGHITNFLVAALNCFSAVSVGRNIFHVQSNISLLGHLDKEILLNIRPLASFYVFDAFKIAAIMIEEHSRESLLRRDMVGILAELDQTVPTTVTRTVKRCALRLKPSLITQQVIECFPKPSNFINLIFASIKKPEKNATLFSKKSVPKQILHTNYRQDTNN